MSLQRILEVARKTGAPVIVTDVAGREPMVVLPLEQFEALAGESIPEPAPKTSSVKDVPEPTGNPIFEEPIPGSSAPKSDDSALGTQNSALPFDAPTPESLENAEISLEERFYLEPLEDK